MEIAAGVQRVAPLIGCGVQPWAAQRGDGGRVRSPIRHGTPQAASAEPQQIRHQARHFDVGFLEQAFQAVPKLHPRASDLILATRHCPPQPLAHIRHQAEDQFMRH